MKTCVYLCQYLAKLGDKSYNMCFFNILLTVNPNTMIVFILPT